MSNPINHPMLPPKLMAAATNIYYVIKVYAMSFKYILCHTNIYYIIQIYIMSHKHKNI